MKKTGNLLRQTLIGLLSGCTLASFSAAKAQDAVEPEAAALLRKMSDYMAGMMVFSFEGEATQENMYDTGQKIMYVKQIQGAVKRPNKLRVARQGMLADQEIVYDGETLTMIGKNLGMYARAPVGPDIEAGLAFAHDGLGIEIPAADLLSRNSYDVLTSDVLSGEYVGTVMVDGVLCHQLAFRGGETDWQIWIENGERPLPRKYVITSRWITGAPQFTIDIKQWYLNPALTDATFEFKPPQGAAEIEFLPVSEADPDARN